MPAVRKAVDIPVLAAGGIYCGRSMLAAMVLGAEGVQVGTRFVCTVEASSHSSFKEAVIRSQEGDTKLILKSLEPVRMLTNPFALRMDAAERAGGTVAELREMMGKARTRKGMFEGDLVEGDLEIGQCAALVRDILPAGKVVQDMYAEYQAALASPLYTPNQ